MNVCDFFCFSYGLVSGLFTSIFMAVYIVQSQFVYKPTVDFLLYGKPHVPKQAPAGPAWRQKVINIWQYKQKWQRTDELFCAMSDTKEAV